MNVNGQKRKKIALNGWLNLYKPLEISSAQAVGKAKFLTQAMKMGHAGTLDPLADGVLPLALGEATKATNLLMDARKTYRFSIEWGTATSTDDREGEVTATSQNRPEKAAIEAVLERFYGRIEQIPPAYSALKINGKRAYELARAGEEVQLKARPVMIHSLKLLGEPQENRAEFRVECGKGTYVRSLARDIAMALGTVGHVVSLTREAVGPFTLGNAISLDFLEKSVHNAPAPLESASFRAWLMPIASVLDDIPALELDVASVKRLRHGQTVSVPNAALGQVAILHQNEMAALCLSEQTPMGFTLKPVRIFNME